MKKHIGWNGHRNNGSEPWSFKKGQTAWNKGKKFSPESRAKMSASHKKLKLSTEHKVNISRAHKALGMPKNVGKSFGLKGKKHPRWKGGITPINRAIRASAEYKLWRKAVFERDKYICVWGGKSHGSKIHADHIKRFADFPELRFAIDNGRTLCESCHRSTDTYGNRKQT